jgi:5-methyltetrahydropteroyltriglutamate--homocysteine methyltransferase
LKGHYQAKVEGNKDAKKIFLQEQDRAQEARADARFDWAWPHIDHACRQLDPPAGVTKVSRRATRYGAYLVLTYEVMVPPKKPSDYRKWAAVRIEALNHALRGLPEERTRYHVCWGSWNGPHAYDVELKNIVDLILKVRVGGYLLEMANPRHEHEWRVWESVKLPTDRMLVPGVISHATNVVEHPALVAERLTRLAKLVGRDNLMAGTDCGFAQGPFVQRVHPSIMWAKLRALVEGARLASKQLWSRRAIV